MFNLAAPTSPRNGGVLADLKLPGATPPAENGGFADILALQGGLEARPEMPAAAIAQAIPAPLPASEAAMALPESGNNLPVAVAALPLTPLGLSAPAPQVSEQAPSPTLATLPELELAAIAQPLVEPEPASPAPQPAPVLPALRIKQAAPEESRTSAKAARPDVSRVLRRKPDEQPNPDPVAPPLKEATALALAPAPAPVAEPQPEKAVAAVALPQPVLPPLVQKQESAAITMNPVLQAPAAMQQAPVAKLQAAPAATPRVAPAVVVAGTVRQQPRTQISPPPATLPSIALLNAAPTPVEESPLRIVPAKADQPVVAMPMAAVFTEAVPTVNLTPMRLRVSQPRVTLPADAAMAPSPAAPLAAPLAPQLGEPNSAPIAQVPGAERPVDFTQLVDRLVAAREAASPQPVSLAVHHTDFGKVSLRFDSDGAGLNVAMSAADPDFARAVAVAAPAQTANAGANTGSDALPQRSPSEQQSGTGQTPSQQQGFSQPKSADPLKPARTQTSNPSPESNDERTSARRGLFA